MTKVKGPNRGRKGNQDAVPEDRDGGGAAPAINFKETFSRVYGALLVIIGLVWLLPWLGRLSGAALLAPVAMLEDLRIPLWGRVVAAILFSVAVLLEVKVSLMRKQFGGCGDTHETVVVIRQGPYRYMRHPGHLAEMTYFTMLPVLLVHWIPFTATALASMVGLIVTYTVMFRLEDRFNLQKWADEYQAYMDAVPAINFIAGWLRVRKNA